jgi:hypothetical protein
MMMMMMMMMMMIVEQFGSGPGRVACWVHGSEWVLCRGHVRN